MAGLGSDSGWAAFGLSSLIASVAGGRRWHKDRKEAAAERKRQDDEKRSDDFRVVDSQTDFIKELRAELAEQRTLVTEQTERLDVQGRRIDGLAELVGRYRLLIETFRDVILALVDILKFHRLDVPDAATRALDAANRILDGKEGES